MIERVFIIVDNDKKSKLENPERVGELNPEATLLKAGFKAGMVLCDIGAGTGIFSFPATRISNNYIYALEKSDSMLELLEERRDNQTINNLIIRKVDKDTLPLNNSCCDMVVMVTVLHEIANKEYMLKEIKRILNGEGRLVIIEFHKRKTPMGPPVDRRLSEEDIVKLCNREGLKTLQKFSLGENFYCAVFEV
jgi:ubiquinone/menaquinone biosynthesis C-methylase UbiE